MACMVRENAPEISAWEAMTVAAVASPTSRYSAQCGRQQIERVLDALRVMQHQRALAKVIEKQSRQHQAKPGEANGPGSEVPQIGIQSLRAGDGQEHRTQNDEPRPPVADKELQPEQRVEATRAPPAT